MVIIDYMDRITDRVPSSKDKELFEKLQEISNNIIKENNIEFIINDKVYNLKNQN